MKKRTKIFLLGCRGSGKTSFVYGLVNLTQGHKSSPFQLVAENQETKRFLSDLRDFAKNAAWPSATSSTKLLDFTIKYRSKTWQKQVFDLNLIEYPGEELQAAIKNLDFDGSENIYAHFTEADFIIVVADPTQDLNTPLCNDRKKMQERQQLLVDALGELWRKRRESDANKNKPADIIVAISKSDLLREDELAQIINLNESFLGHIKTMAELRSVRCYPFSACGPAEVDEKGQTILPQDPVPSGFEKLFDELSIKKITRSPSFFWLLSICCLLVMGLVFGVAIFQSHKRNIENEKKKWVVDAGAIEEEALSGTVSLDRLRDLNKDINEMVRDSGTYPAVKDAKEVISESYEDALWKFIRSNQNQGKIEKEISEYRHFFPNGKHADDVHGIEQNMIGRSRQKLKTIIRTIKVRNSNDLLPKAKAIRDYLDKSSGGSSAANMARAATFAEKLAGKDKLKVMLKGCGHDCGKRRSMVKWTEAKKEVFESDSETLNNTVDGVSCILNRSAWTSFPIEYWDLNYGNEEIAYQRFNLIEKISWMDGKRHLLLEGKEDGWEHCEVYVILAVSWETSTGWEQIPVVDLEAYGKYICPGDDW